MVTNLKFLGLALGLRIGRPPAGKAEGTFAHAKGEGQGQSWASFHPLAQKVSTLVNGCQFRVSRIRDMFSDWPPARRQSS